MPLSYYQQQCQLGHIRQDDLQLVVLHKLQKLTEALLREARNRKKLAAILRKPKCIKGLYLWGDVGIGKTFLMDCFYNNLDLSKKKRMHFHAFMQMIHTELKNLQGRKDPLKVLAQIIAQKYLVICFDEFVVTDIVDAMLLGRLFQLLFGMGVCLVTTSNCAPDNLYLHGLQRTSFLPAIAAIKSHTEVVHLPSQDDYRKQRQATLTNWYTPDYPDRDFHMENRFASLADNSKISTDPICICHRDIKIIKQAGKFVWFDFNELCKSPRSQQDYLELARLYTTVFISHIPAIPSFANNAARLFINMVDVFYDAQIRIVCASDIAIDDIYIAGRLLKDFKRTCSRLHEMQAWVL